jgi:Outer membrane protein beta-barrel domain
LIQKALSRLAAALLLCVAGSALAQSTPLDRQLARFDLGVQGMGIFTHEVSGPVIPPSAPNYPSTLTQDTSNTLGALVTLRYVAKPYFGLEGNFGYARYTESYNYAPYLAQTGVNEFTLGYVVTPPHLLLGLQPYAAAGAGSTEFKPTSHGGEGLPKQARMTYYYNVGLQQTFFSEHFGLRGGFRQTFYLAPDFGQNYLTIKKHTFTSEPLFGFYLRF